MALISLIVLFLMLLTFLSAVESSISQLSVVTLRALAEKHEGKNQILNLIAEDRLQILIPLHLGTQTSLLTISILVTFLAIKSSPRFGLAVAFIVMVLVVLLFRQLIPRLITVRDPGRALLALLPAFEYVYKPLRSLAIPISSVLDRIKRSQQEDHPHEEAEEATEEQIQAYIDVGEEEGILEEAEGHLIQSVVEFGDRIVREVMTPRTKIVAISEKATLGELRSLMIKSRFSRIPVYREQIDNIVGVAHMRHLLAAWDGTNADAPMTSMIRSVRFVPETKKVADLLKEMQQSGDHMAIVVDEFGGVAGLVTIEDLIEELVGEIRDEDEVELSEISQENSQSYILQGTTELRKLDELFDVNVNGVDCATVAGLIINLLGRVPAAGEKLEYKGLIIEVLEADSKRIHRLRVRSAR